MLETITENGAACPERLHLLFCEDLALMVVGGGHGDRIGKNRGMHKGNKSG
jgi:hypothetical protein